MPNGIDGFIDSQLRDALDDYVDAQRRQDSEADEAARRARSFIPAEEAHIEQYTEPRIREALDAYYRADEETKKAHREGVARLGSAIKGRDEDYYRYIEDQMIALPPAISDVDDNLFGWIGNFFGDAWESLTNFDITMPSIRFTGFEALGILPGILSTGFKILESLLTVNEETFVGDTIKMLALQEKVKEKLGEVVK